MVFIFAFLLFAANIAFNYLTTAKGKYYMTEINRACADIEKYGITADLSSYVYIGSTAFLSKNADETEIREFYENNDAYVIKPVEGVFAGYVKFSVEMGVNTNFNGVHLLINVLISSVGTIVIILLVYIKKRIIKPFNEINELW